MLTELVTLLSDPEMEYVVLTPTNLEIIAHNIASTYQVRCSHDVSCPCTDLDYVPDTVDGTTFSGTAVDAPVLCRRNLEIIPHNIASTYQSGAHTTSHHLL